MGAAMSGHSQLGIPASVGKEFIEEDPGGKLPERVKDDPEEREPLEQFRIAPGDIELANRVYGPMFGEEEREGEGEEDEWSPEAREAALKARQAKAGSGGHLQLTATPRSSGKAAFKTTAGSHSEVEGHLGKMHSYIKGQNAEPHNVSIHNTRTGEVHHATVSPHGITGRSYGSESFDAPDAITAAGAHQAAHVLLTRHGGSHPGPHADERDQVDPAPGVSRNEQQEMEGYSHPAGEPLPAAAREGDVITHGGIARDAVPEYEHKQVGPPGMTLSELQKANEEFWKQKVPGT